MTLNTCLFYILAVITGASAIGVVITQNIVRAATWLLFALLGTAGLYFLLGADFVGATQILVYVGGTLVLVIFGVMLTAQSPFVNMKISAAEWLIGLSVGLLLYGVLSVSFWKLKPEENYEPKEQLASSVVLGESLLGLTEATPDADVTGIEGHEHEHEHEKKGEEGEEGEGEGEGKHEHEHKHARKKMAYLLPFEIVSIHLLVGLIGAAYLARAKRKRRAPIEPTTETSAE